MNPWYYRPFFLLFPLSVFGADILPPGHRPVPPGVHALAGAKVIVKPGEVIDDATIVIRDGFIQAVGKDVTPPADARVWEMKGATIYAGLIDSCLTLNPTNRPISSPRTEFDAAATAERLLAQVLLRLGYTEMSVTSANPIASANVHHARR